MNLSLTLHAVARHLPDRPAVSWEDGALSYAALEDQVRRIAGALLGRHALQPGARVALAMENCPEFLPALYGIWRAGFAAVPMNSKLHAREMAWIMADSETRLCLASPKLADGLSALPLSSARCRRSSPPARPTIRPAGRRGAQATCRPIRKPRPGSSTPAAPPAGPRAPC